MKLTELLPQITPLPHTIGMNLLADGKHLAIWDEPGKRVVAMFAPPDNHTEEDDANAIYYRHAANVLPELIKSVRQYDDARNLLDSFHAAVAVGANTPPHINASDLRASIDEAYADMMDALERAENIKLDSV